MTGLIPGRRIFDGYRGAILQAPGTDLRHGSAGHRNRIKLGKNLVRSLAERLEYHFQHVLGGKGRHLILQFGQFIGNIEWNQVAAGGQHLPEFDENRPQLFRPPGVSARHAAL